MERLENQDLFGHLCMIKEASHMSGGKNEYSINEMV